jgi:DNA sulfur modification protein DndE
MRLASIQDRLAEIVGILVLVAGRAAAEGPASPAARGDRLDRLPQANAKALDAWSYSAAINAATWGSPAVIMHCLRHNDAVGPRPKAAPNAIWRMANISTPELAEQAGYVTPNVNTVYGFGFLDLGPQPVILTLPNSRGRYYMVEVVDMWTNAFAYPAGVDHGYGGGTVAMVGPGWKGSLPPGIRRIDAPTRWVLIQPRVHLKGQADLPGARAVLEGITVRGLAEYLGRTPAAAPRYSYLSPALKDPRQPVSALDFKDPLQFWEILSEVINENPPPADQATALVPMFRPLGLELGKTWDRTKVHPIVIRAMRRAAEDIGPMLNNLPAGRFADGWFWPPPTLGNFGTDFPLRAITARVGLTANTPREAVYLMANLDQDLRPMTGAGR